MKVCIYWLFDFSTQLQWLIDQISFILIGNLEQIRRLKLYDLYDKRIGLDPGRELLLGGHCRSKY